MVTLIVRRHRHDRTRAVAHQHKVRHPDRDVLAAQGIDGINAQRHTFFLDRLDLCLADTTACTFVDKSLDRGIAFSRLHGERVISGNRHEGRTKEGIRPGGKHPQGLAPRCQCEVHLDPVRAPDPVTLHGLDRIRPARHPVKLLKQFIGIGRDPYEPLRNLAFFDNGAGTPTLAVNHLFIGEHRLVYRIPVDYGIFAVSETLFDKTGKEPLLPAVVIGLAGGDLARPVVGKAHALQLRAHMRDVLVGPLCRRHGPLDGGILSRQSKSIPAHGLQHIAPEHSLVTAHDVTDGVVAHVPHVQLP